MAAPHVLVLMPVPPPQVFESLFCNAHAEISVGHPCKCRQGAGLSSPNVNTLTGWSDRAVGHTLDTSPRLVTPIAVLACGSTLGFGAMAGNVESYLNGDVDGLSN